VDGPPENFGAEAFNVRLFSESNDDLQRSFLSRLCLVPIFYRGQKKS
jgi:hypothetical protein